jgi:hypothetical protein
VHAPVTDLLLVIYKRRTPDGPNTAIDVTGDRSTSGWSESISADRRLLLIVLFHRILATLQKALWMMEVVHTAL